MSPRSDHHGFNRVRAAGKIAPLLSRRHLSELPWFFRICVQLIGIAVILLALAVALIPLVGLILLFVG